MLMMSRLKGLRAWNSVTHNVVHADAACVFVAFVTDRGGRRAGVIDPLRNPVKLFGSAFNLFSKKTPTVIVTERHKHNQIMLNN